MGAVPAFLCELHQSQDAVLGLVEPGNRSWTRTNGLRWGPLARRNDDAGYPLARRSNTAPLRQRGSIGRIALSPIN